MDGVIEMFARNAFVLAGGVPLQWGLHGGPALCPSSCMFLFQDEYGLGFEAAVAPHTVAVGVGGPLAGVVARIRSGGIGASVNMPSWRWRGISAPSGQAYRVIESATIDHITLTSNPAYKDTAVWCADTPSARLLPLQQELAAAWERSQATSRRAGALTREAA